jgi:hypothetical protein
VTEPSRQPADDHEAWLATLARELEAARETAGRLAAGHAPLGLRAVEPVPGRRWYLCAFEGPGFLCLDAGLGPERSGERVREVAAAGLVVEHAEGLLDAEARDYLAGASGRLLTLDHGAATLAEPVAEVGERALDLARWRLAPQREVASVPALDAAIRLHDRLTAAYGAFVAASEPLVSRQDALAPELVSALRVFEEAAGRAGVGEPLAKRLGAALPDCQEGAAQVLDAHLTPVERPPE